jgi:hypothetical protein
MLTDEAKIMASRFIEAYNVYMEAPEEELTAPKLKAWQCMICCGRFLRQSARLHSFEQQEPWKCIDEVKAMVA